MTRLYTRIIRAIGVCLERIGDWGQRNPWCLYPVLVPVALVYLPLRAAYRRLT